MAATVEIEDRKRPLDFDHLTNPANAAKRPHLDRSPSSFASIGSNGVKKEAPVPLEDDDEEAIPAYKGLEAYRKEAIYRQMREAKRELQRSQSTTQRLRDAMESMNERCAAFNRFWDTLVTDVRALVKDDDFSQAQKSTLMESIPLTSRKPAIAIFSESLQERNTSMKAILSRIASLGSRASPDVDQLQARCHRLGEESASLRSQLTLTITDKEALAEELGNTIEQLRKAEKKFDRMHSATVKATERPGAKAEEEAEQAKVEAADAEKAAALQRKAQAEGELQGENGAAGNHAANSSISTEELEEFKRLAETRLDESNRWRDEVKTLRLEMEQLRGSMVEIVDARLLESHLYKELHSHFEEAQKQRARVESANERIVAENADLRQKRDEFEANAKVNIRGENLSRNVSDRSLLSAPQLEADSQVDNLRAGLKAHEADLARIRGQRDDFSASLMEKKQREAVRLAQIDEMKALVHSKDKRIVALKSEVWRLQYSLASKGGDEGTMQRLRSKAEGGEEAVKQGEVDVELIETLQDRLRAAEETVQDLKRQLEARSSTTSEQELVSKVASLQSELDRLSVVLKEAGSGGEGEVTVEEAKVKWIKQTEEITRLKRELTTSQESTTALCDELDKIGDAYSESQKVATNRIVEAGRMEDKIMRLTAEKSKADQKYFTAMRNSESIEGELKILQRNSERQSKVIETYRELEKTFQGQLQKSEHDVSQLRAVIAAQNDTTLHQQREIQSKQEAEDRLLKASRAANEEAQKCTQDYVEESKVRQQAQERCDKLQRELDKCKRQLATSGASSSRKKSVGGDDMQVEYLNVSVAVSFVTDDLDDGD